MFSHGWRVFSKGLIEEIGHTISPEGAVTKWLPHPQLKSPEEEFAKEGTVYFFLPLNFSIRFGRRVLDLNHSERWSSLLMNREVRQHFLSVSNNVAQFADAREILLLPEGTILQDSLCEDVDFDEIKRRAHHEFGPPDLDISKIYAEDDIRRMVGKRVHYFLIPAGVGR